MKLIEEAETLKNIALFIILLLVIFFVPGEW
jgi:hypothetical protein